MNLKDTRFDKRKHLKWIYRGGYHRSVFIGGYHQFLTGYQSNACIIALSTKVLNLQIKKSFCIIKFFSKICALSIGNGTSSSFTCVVVR